MYVALELQPNRHGANSDALVASFYQDTESFACITNAAIKLSLSQVNDNTCDCPDGSDEPGTAACASIDPLSPGQPLPGSMSGSTNTGNALSLAWLTALAPTLEDAHLGKLDVPV